MYSSIVRERSAANEPLAISSLWFGVKIERGTKGQGG